MKTIAIALTSVALLTTAATAQTVVQRSSEHRFQLDFHVPDAALQKMLPPGWTPAVATAGPAKDANLRVIFIDRIAGFGADGKPLTSGATQLVYVAIPVKQTSGTETGQMIIAGWTKDATDAPGTFGVFRRADGAMMQRTISNTRGAEINDEYYAFTAATGERFNVRVKYQRGALAKGGGEVKFFDPANPRKYQIFKTEQALDITRNATTNPPDHVMEFSYSVGGGKLASLFDGTERVLSWDSFPWYDRTVLNPP
jgi:hypothetical protein